MARGLGLVAPKSAEAGPRIGINFGFGGHGCRRPCWDPGYDDCYWGHYRGCRHLRRHRHHGCRF